MSPRTFLVSVLALVLGGSAAFGVRTMMASRQAGAPAETVKVVVTTVDIARGGKITKDKVELRDFPKASAPDGVATRIEDVVDHGTSVPLFAGEPLHLGKIISKGGLPVQEGMRAVTIQTRNVASGVAGFVLPGDWVDVLMTLQAKGQNDPTGGGSTKTLLQYVKVLAVGQEVSAPESGMVDATKMREVTLEVTPGQAQLLIHGSSEGELTLALRNPTDLALDTSDRVVNTKDLLGRSDWGEQAKSMFQAFGETLKSARAKAPAAAPEAAPAGPVEPPRKAIRLFRGGNYESRSYIEFPAR